MAAASTTAIDNPVARLLDQREEQGLPRGVTDPAALERIAAIIRGAARKPVSP